MGNKMCKKKTDAPAVENTTKSPTAFDRFMGKFSSQKQKWKSDANLDEKQVNSYQVNAKTPTKDETDNASEPLTKQSEWTDVPLVVPDRKIENSFSKNNNNEDNHTPIPPPRKKKTLRETLGSLIQYKKPVEEQVMVQKKINYKCPCCEDGFHNSPRIDKKMKENGMNGKLDKKLNGKESSSLKEVKKRKTPSIASLPNYTDFKLTIAGETNADTLDLEKHSSVHSLPDEAKKNGQVKPGGDKIDNVLTRARSFGSLLPTMLLHKMSTAKAPLAEIESDDSLGGLDDWGGLNMIEHYKPRDSSLPRPRRPKTQEELLADIENQIEFGIEEDDAEYNKDVEMRRLQENVMVKNAVYKDLRNGMNDVNSENHNEDFSRNFTTEMIKEDVNQNLRNKNHNIEIISKDLNRNIEMGISNSQSLNQQTGRGFEIVDNAKKNTELRMENGNSEMKLCERDQQKLKKPEALPRSKDLQMQAGFEKQRPEVPIRNRDLQIKNDIEMIKSNLSAQSSNLVNAANKKNSELNETFFTSFEDDSRNLNQCTNNFNRNEEHDETSSNQTTNYIIPLEEEPVDYQNSYEHSSLMKILEKYSGSDKIEIENANEGGEMPPPKTTSPRDKHPINDFLNAERGAHFTGVKNTITT